MNETDISQHLREAVLQAVAEKSPLRLVGGNSKAFYGRAVQGRPLDLAGHSGIVDYEPTELVITARAGTPLREIEDALAGQGQMLAFEPPHFGESATLGGTVACGLSGPRRPYAGAVRDFVLGIKLLNGKGEILKFGGQVMKNVAGYDVSRLMVGALGLLGVILEVSLKVLPRPVTELTLVHQCPLGDAIEMIKRWSSKPYPISATCHHGNYLYVRLSGMVNGVQAARRQIGGDIVEEGPDVWSALREQEHPFFSGNRPLWRISLPPATAPLALSGEWLVEWGGAQRWLHSESPAERIRQVARVAGGHAVLFRGGDRQGQVFHPLDPVLKQLHHRLKQSFDPQNIFNPGRMYPDL
jgi:glycolate oxidase FAD binding subunit